MWRPFSSRMYRTTVLRFYLLSNTHTNTNSRMYIHICCFICCCLQSSFNMLFYIFSYFCSCRVAHIGSWHTVPLKSMLFSMRCLTFAQKLIFVCRLIIIILFFFSFRNFFCFKFVYMHVLFVCVCVFYMLHRHLRRCTHNLKIYTIFVYFNIFGVNNSNLLGFKTK